MNAKICRNTAKKFIAESAPSRRAPLSAAEINRRLNSLGEPWRVCGNELRGEWRFKTFAETAALVRAAIQTARLLNHHPRVEFGFHDCKISYTTHSAGALTALDFESAGRVLAAAKRWTRRR